MIVFRSEVGPDIMMFDEVARRMLDLIGKEHAPRGVVTVEQLPEAIARLKAAVAEDRARNRPAAEDDDEGGGVAPPVGLAQRAVPLIELLEISLGRDKPVTWGV